MRRFIVGFFATIGVLCLVLLIGAFAAGFWVADSFRAREPLPDSVVLELDFNGPIDESPLLPELAGLLDEDAPLSLIDYVDALDRAAADDRVTALFADLSTLSIGLAQAQELRAAVFRFRRPARPPSPSPTVSRAARTVPTTSPAPSTGSGCSRRACWA